MPARILGSSDQEARCVPNEGDTQIELVDLYQPIGR